MATRGRPTHDSRQLVLSMEFSILASKAEESAAFHEQMAALLRARSRELKAIADTTSCRIEESAKGIRDGIAA